MNIEEYKKLITTNGFDEYPSLNDGKHLLSKFLSFKDIDIDLKIYLSVLILCRSYYGTYTAYYNDVKWFLEGFFQSFEGDLIKPFLTEPIKLSAELILSEDAFSKGIVGTTFMFGILEFYAKNKLGFNPIYFNFFDKKGKH